MTDDRRPWWYSGDDASDEPAPAVGSDSGDDTSGEPESDEPESGVAFDWTALVSGAARMVDWATSTVMAPHAEHDDPAAHPQCVVCRTILLVGDPAGLGAPRGDGTPEDTTDTADPGGPEPIRWIPIREDSTLP